MKISTIILLALFLGFIIWRVTVFLLERRRQKTADKEGVVVYATFVSSEPIKFFGRPQTDVEKKNLDAVLNVLPALNSPTVSHLRDENWVAVNTILEQSVVRDVIPRLKAAGGTGIVEYPLSKVVL